MVNEDKLLDFLLLAWEDRVTWMTEYLTSEHEFTIEVDRWCAMVVDIYGGRVPQKLVDEINSFKQHYRLDFLSDLAEGVAKMDH